MQGFAPVSGAPVADGGAGTISASASQTLAGLTQAAVGPGDIAQGSAAQTLGALTQIAAATDTNHAAAAQTLDALTQAASSVFNAMAAEALADLTQTAMGAAVINGSIANVFDGLSVDLEVVTINRFASAAQTLDGITESPVVHTITYAIAAQTLSGIGQTAIGLATVNIPECGSGWIHPAGKALDALLRHLPEGVAWLAWRLPDKTAFRLAKAIARAYDDIWIALCRLASELDPRTTTEMVTDWETALSLPDPCLPVPNNLFERRQRIMLRLSMRRWSTAQDWHELASLFGLTIVITPGWCVQKPALYPACYPKRYDLFPRLGRFRVYIDIEDVNFGGYDYGAANRGPGYPIPYGVNAPQATGFMCIIDRVRPANVVVLWNQHPQNLPCVHDCAVASNPPFPTLN